MPMLITIISGGQTGVDQIALRVAKELGYPTGGTAPKGWRTDDGPAPWLETEYGLKESDSSQYNVRTIQNVRDACMTVWFGDTLSPGGILTLRVARYEQTRREYPILINPVADDLAVYLGTLFAIRMVNIAGNRLRTNPAATHNAEIVLRTVLVR